jgi:hypothetical protein
MDVHCCGCHSGFLFDVMTCTCLDGEEPGLTRIAEIAMCAASDPHAAPEDYRRALRDICNLALKAEGQLAATHAAIRALPRYRASCIYAGTLVEDEAGDCVKWSALVRLLGGEKAHD